MAALEDSGDYFDEHERPVSSVKEALHRLSSDAKSFWWGTVDRIEKPTELEFYRNYVAQNKPVVITNAFNDWPALSKWKDLEYLRRQAGDCEITADCTPTGHGDCVVTVNGENVFVKPYQHKIKFGDYLDILQNKRHFNGVYYLSAQNDCFRKEFQPLWDDVTSSVLDWGTKAFGNAPEAVNLWLGDSRAVSSLHKDFYENLYCVVAGTKHFTLLPPTDIAYLKYLTCREATYKYDEANDKWSIEYEEPPSTVPWIPGDVDYPDYEKYPWMAHLSPIHVEVHAGEMLYLPSLHFHRVSQSGSFTMAVNYWFDMAFGQAYTYYKFVENVASVVDMNSSD